MSRWQPGVLPVVLALGAVLVAVLILRDAPPADWLTVQATPVLVKDRPFSASITLTRPQDVGFLSFDLHGHDTSGRRAGCIASSPSQRVSSGTTVYRFVLHLRSNATPDRVHAVICLSSSGRWSDRIEVATSETFPVVDAAEATPNPGPLHVYSSIDEPDIHVQRPNWVRGLIAGFWLLAGVGAAARWLQHAVPRVFPTLPLVCAILAAMAATDALSRVADIARLAAHNDGWYDDRRNLQQFATAGLVCLAGLAAALGVRARRRRYSPALVLGLALYLAVEMAGVLSLHEVDQFLARPLGSGAFPIDTLLRLAATVCACAGIAEQTRVARARPAG